MKQKKICKLKLDINQICANLIASFLILIITPLFDPISSENINSKSFQVNDSITVPSDIIDINYMRLFGCNQVTMLNQPSEAYPTVSKEFKVFMNWWQETFGKDLPIRSEVYEQLYVFDQDQSANLLEVENLGYQYENEYELIRLSCQEDSLAKIFADFYYDYLIDSDTLSNQNNKFDKTCDYADQKGIDRDGFTEYLWFELYAKVYLKMKKYQINEIWNHFLNCTNNIGYVFLILENNSQYDLINLKFNYYLYKRNFTNPTIVNDTNIENLIDRHKIKTKIIPHIKPNQKIIWLISIYFKDNKGYPKKYISNVILPINVTYQKKGEINKITQNIRLPLKDSAYKVSMPYGWFQQ
jgi:hypothetical protein